MAVEKIKSFDDVLEIRKQLRVDKKRLVFTNGCFDILHVGHVRYLTQSRALGDALIVGLNSDRSVELIKGRGRPITPESERAEILAALSCIDYVFTFDDPTPGRIIDQLIPDILVKGADWGITEIVGRETVEKNGGRVHRFPLVEGSSTTSIVERVLSRFGANKKSDSGKERKQ
jgi:D-beta-D-heptose 7-phosphate kinase/D-beta-D-heptose 1-phosphate adenosyltransferase